MYCLNKGYRKIVRIALFYFTNLLKANPVIPN